MNINLNKVQSMLEWLKTKLLLDALSSKAQNRIVKRGQVYKCNFGIGIGSEMQKERPCVIIQNDIGNIKSPNTIIAPITHNTSTLPCMSLITTQKDEQGNIILDGQVNTANIICVSKARLGNKITKLSTNDMKKIDESLAKTTGLMKYYGDLNNKLVDKLKYIERIKKDRNEAQDFVNELQKEFNVSNRQELKEKIKTLSEMIDK